MHCLADPQPAPPGVPGPYLRTRALVLAPRLVVELAANNGALAARVPHLALRAELTHGHDGLE